METIYLIRGGGQLIRQSSQNRNPVYFEKKESTLPSECGCSGVDSFTNTIWSTDFEDLQRWANDWAGKKVKLKEK